MAMLRGFFFSKPFRLGRLESHQNRFLVVSGED